MTTADTPDEQRESLSARPEARFALVAGIGGGLLAALISVKAIFASGSSTAAIGFVFVPFIMMAAMVLAGAWGLALGCVWYALRGERRYYGVVLAMAWAFAAAVPAYAGWQVWYGLALERAVAETTRMDAAALQLAMAQSPWRDNRFFIGAVAQNKAASEALLDRLAQLPETLPEAQLHEPLGSLWDVKLDNRKGLSAMRLIAFSPNVGPHTLERLARGQQGQQSSMLLGDILGNPKTPMRVLEPHFNSTEYLIEWGLALNPNLPLAVMQRLATSPNLYTRFNLTYTAATPRVILEALAKDPDATLANTARQAMERLDKRSQNPEPGSPAAGMTHSR